MWLTSKTLKIPTILAILLTGMITTLIYAANFVQNDGLEAPFDKYDTWTGSGVTFDLEVAHNWEKFHITGGDKLRYFRASALHDYFGYTESRGGDAQLYWSTSPFDAGIYQQISGLTIGEHYGFQAGILQVYGNTNSGIDGKMFRSVGVDPTGGTDPAAGTVMWGPEEGLNADWFYPGIGFTATSTTATVFIRVRAIDDAPTYEENAVWTDDTFLDITPTTALTLTATSPTQVNAVWSGSPRSGFTLWAYEAQYRRSSDSTWTNLQSFNSRTATPPTGTSTNFTVTPNTEYVVRARTWHEQTSGDSHEVPGPWVEQTITVGGMVSGKILDNRGYAFAGATVAVNGDPTTSTSSNGGGNYTLLTGAGDFELVATTPSGWATEQPIQVTVPDLATIVPLTLTLTPPDNTISNGDFETGPTGWTVQGDAPLSLTGGQYSGQASLWLTGSVTISQTGLISGSFEPGLSFWYKTGGDTGTFTAEISGNETLAAAGTRSIPAAEQWSHVWLPLNITGTYTGPIGARFSLTQTGGPISQVYLDAVTLGASRQISHVFLPLIIK